MTICFQSFIKIPLSFIILNKWLKIEKKGKSFFITYSIYKQLSFEHFLVFVCFLAKYICSLFTKLHSWDHGRRTPSWRYTSWSQRINRSTHCSQQFPLSSQNVRRSGTPTSTSWGTPSSTTNVGRCCLSFLDSDSGESIPEVKTITWCILTKLSLEKRPLTYNVFAY